MNTSRVYVQTGMKHSAPNETDSEPTLNDGSEMTGRSTRRSVVRNIGLGAASLSVLGAGTSMAKSSPSEEENTTADTSGGLEDEPIAQPDAMINATTSFSPYDISLSETSILQSRWQFQTVPPIPGNYYQIDILVNAQNIWQPETVAENVGSNDITKDWEYRSSSPVGPAYHWQAKIWVADVLGASAYVDAEIDPSARGRVEAKTGTFWPWQSWSTAYLDIE